MEVEAGTVLEVEDTKPKNVYLVLKGSVALYKKLESMYDTEDGKMINMDGIDLISNPKDSGN